MANFPTGKSYNYAWQNAKFAGVTYSGSNISQFTNDAGYITSSASSSYATSASYALTASYALNGSVNTSSLVSTSSFNQFTSSYYLDSASFSSSIASLTDATSSYVLNSQTSSMTVLSASYAKTASLAPDYLPLTGGTINGNVIVNGTASISFLNVTYESASVIYSSGSNQFGDATNDTQTLIGRTIVTGSFEVTGSANIPNITGSLQGTASWSEYSITASAILGGKATHVPYFITDTTLATSSIYQSGSSTVIINQDNATSAAPEALYVWQPSTSSFNVISGKGNLNNYLQLNIQNTNQGIDASSDVVATANNGSEVDNYIDMGINSENYTGFLGGPNDAYLYAHSNNLWIGNINDGYKVYFFNSSSLLPIIILNADTADITGSLFGTSSWAQNSISSSHATTASYASNAELLDGKDSSIFATTGSNVFRGNQTVTGSLFTSGSNTLIGTTTLTGSLNITGSTIQTGNNTLLGNTTLSGSIIISGSTTTPTVQVYGNVTHDGYIRFNPVSTNIDQSISASYIYVSGSTNDLYFTQNGQGYSNTTRLRWLEGNLYTGLLNGGLITTQSSTIYQVSSGSGVIVNLNASLNDNPYPTVQYLNWPNLSASIAPLSASYDQSFVAINSSGQIYVQGTPYTDGQYNTEIPIGIVIHQNRSTINAVQTFPGVAYGWKQRSFDFIKAFGPLKISGYTLTPSGSSTGSLVLSGGTSWVDGRNYTVDPNNPSYITEATGITTSKIYRYYQSGSNWQSTWGYNTNGGTGFPTIDPTQYSNAGTLTSVGSNKWTIQRVFYFPNSATKAFYIYYGNAEYANEAAALAAVSTETFTEAPNTAANAIYVGYMLLRNDADFTVAASYRIYEAGLFRGSGASGTGGGGGSTTLAGLTDVNIISPTNGQPLVYNASSLKWENSSTLTASLSGNASTATSASYATTSSYSLTALSSSYALTASYALNGGGGGVSFPYTGSAIITGSLVVTGSTISTLGFTGSLQGTASWSDNSVSSSYALSSSYAVTASHALVADTLLGSVTSASYAATASMGVNFVVQNTLTLNGTLTDSATVLSTIVGSNNLFTQATGSRTSAFGKYTLFNGSNARAGEFITVWNGTTSTYTDVSTTDIGNTSDITFSSAIVSGDIQINAVAATSGWTVKMLTTYI